MGMGMDADADADAGTGTDADAGTGTDADAGTGTRQLLQYALVEFLSAPVIKFATLVRIFYVFIESFQ
jgi:hypothetical protein